MSTADDKDDVLSAFAIEPRHDRATLERYLAEYPELTEDLVDLSNELRMVRSFDPAQIAAEADEAVDAAFQELLAAGPAKKVVADMFATYKGRAFADLAVALNIPRAILQALRDRLVEPGSIPLRFMQRFAAATGNDLAIVRDYFFLPPVEAVVLNFKSDEKPGAVKRVLFEELVSSTPSLTDQQRVILEEDIASYGRQ